MKGGREEGKEGEGKARKEGTARKARKVEAWAVSSGA